jgi:hypothetical protein
MRPFESFRRRRQRHKLGFGGERQKRPLMMESVRTDPRALNPAGGAERVRLPPLPSLPAQHGIAGLRKAWAIAGILVGFLCYGCVGGGPHGGEPGSRHLNADEERLLALVPEGIRPTCVTRYEDWFERTEPVLHVATEGHGAAIAGLFCTWRPQGNAPDDDRGILRLTYLLFPTRAAMEGDYWGNWVGPWDFGTDCLENALAELSYRTTSGRTGRLLCHGDRRFQPELAWTDDQRLVITNAFQIPFPDLDREDLYRWWREQVGPGRVVLAPGAEQPKHARCLGKAATIVSDDRATHLTGTPGEDVIVGFAGEDLIDGLDGTDLVCAGGGNDRVVGGGGNDVLSGGPGDDWLGADPGLWDKASFEDSTSPVRIHLAERSARGEGHDVLLGIDDLGDRASTTSSSATQAGTTSKASEATTSSPEARAGTSSTGGRGTTASRAATATTTCTGTRVSTTSTGDPALIISTTTGAGPTSASRARN